MDAGARPNVLAQFVGLAEPRVERTTRHSLASSRVIAIGAVSAGAERWNEIEAFGEAQAAWLGRFLALPHGSPSHDPFTRVCAALDPAPFQASFLSWREAVASVLPAEVVALDGTTRRGSHARPRGNAAVQLVSAWATATRLVRAQVKVDAKANAIPALPAGRRALSLTGVWSRLMRWALSLRSPSRSLPRAPTPSWRSTPIPPRSGPL